MTDTPQHISAHHCAECQQALGENKGYQIGVDWTSSWSDPFWLCDPCIRERYGVAVRKSVVVPGELGLFATRRFAIDEMIVPYDGPLVEPRELFLRTGLYTSPYGIVLNEDKLIVSDNPRLHGLGRYANDAFPFSQIEENNAAVRHFTVGPPEDPDCVSWVGLFAREPIEEGQEITYAYGSGYWSAWKPGPRRWKTQLKSLWNRFRLWIK